MSDFNAPAQFVVDTSVWVAFSAVKRLDVFWRILGRAAIPGAVYAELITEGVGWIEAEQAQEEISAKSNRVEIVDLDATGIERIDREGLDPGEREVISLAKAWKITPVIDEPKGRRIASKHGLRPIGTLGILALAVRQGVIASVGPIVVEMRAKSLRFSDALLAEFMKNIGEQWPP